MKFAEQIKTVLENELMQYSELTGMIVKEVAIPEITYGVTEDSPYPSRYVVKVQIESSAE